MVINKIGWHHLAYGMNCQDAGWETEGLKAVCDGCSEGKHSEVGAKGFCHLLETGLPPAEAFVKLTALFGQTPDSIRDYLCFTVLLVRETAEAFILTYCGDGYVLGETQDGRFLTQELEGGEYPPYYAYRYVDAALLSRYREGAAFRTRRFSKHRYKNIGIASDGIRYLQRKPAIYEEFTHLLQCGKASAVKRLINREQKLCKDDITIVI